MIFQKKSHSIMVGISTRFERQMESWSCVSSRRMQSWYKPHLNGDGRYRERSRTELRDGEGKR